MGDEGREVCGLLALEDGEGGTPDSVVVSSLFVDVLLVEDDARELRDCRMLVGDPLVVTLAILVLWIEEQPEINYLMKIKTKHLRKVVSLKGSVATIDMFAKPRGLVQYTLTFSSRAVENC